MGFEPMALVRHSHRRTEGEFLTQVRTYGTGLAAMYTSLIVERPATLLELCAPRAGGPAPPAPPRRRAGAERDADLPPTRPRAAARRHGARAVRLRPKPRARASRTQGAGVSARGADDTAQVGAAAGLRRFRTRAMTRRQRRLRANVATALVFCDLLMAVLIAA